MGTLRFGVQANLVRQQQRAHSAHKLGLALTYTESGCALLIHISIERRHCESCALGKSKFGPVSLWVTVRVLTGLDRSQSADVPAEALPYNYDHRDFLFPLVSFHYYQSGCAQSKRVYANAR